MLLSFYPFNVTSMVVLEQMSVQLMPCCPAHVLIVLYLICTSQEQ